MMSMQVKLVIASLIIWVINAFFFNDGKRVEIALNLVGWAFLIAALIVWANA